MIWARDLGGNDKSGRPYWKVCAFKLQVLQDIAFALSLGFHASNTVADIPDMVDCLWDALSYISEHHDVMIYWVLPAQWKILAYNRVFITQVTRDVENDTLNWNNHLRNVAFSLKAMSVIVDALWLGIGHVRDQ